MPTEKNQQTKTLVQDEPIAINDKKSIKKSELKPKTKSRRSTKKVKEEETPLLESKVPEVKKSKRTTKKVVAERAELSVDLSTGRSSAVKKEPVVIPDVVEVLEEKPVEPIVQEEVSVSVSKSRRSAVTLEELELQFDTILEQVENEIKEKETNNAYKIPLKKLRSLLSSMKRVKKDSVKMSRKGKKKRVVDPAISKQWGFEKPVMVSRGMCKFAGWNENEMHSRTDVTKFICNYIKDHDLQNPENRKQIIPDKKLTKLLSYDAGSEEPLTYCSLQVKMKPHFV